MIYEEMAGNVFGEDVTAGNPNKRATVRCRGICDFLRIDNNDIEEVCLAREILLIFIASHTTFDSNNSEACGDAVVANDQ